jgi:hypothetical protein
MIRIGRIALLVMFVSIQLLWLMGSAVAKDIENLPKTNTSGFQLIPEVGDKKIQDTYDTLVKKNNGNKHQFRDKYNQTATGLNVNEQLATWVMNWDTIIAYGSIVITFISNLGLVVGAWFIIYSGYQYAMSAFGTKEDNGKAIKNAFIGIAVIATSYGIFRLLVRMFIE